MTHSLELNHMGLTPLSKSETNGGWWIPLAVALFVSAINNFDDIHHGISDGWNGTPRHS
jgi:hypothetical protein